MIFFFYLLCFSFNEVKNKYDKVIKVFRSDKKKQNTFLPAFLLFLNSHDVPHQPTCFYTSQQNGIIKRKKNKHFFVPNYLVLMY